MPSFHRVDSWDSMRWDEDTVHSMGALLSAPGGHLVTAGCMASIPSGTTTDQGPSDAPRV